MYGYFTDEQMRWISDHIDGKNWPQITEEYNSYFSSDIKPATFRYRCIRDGFVQKKKTGGIVEFTEEQDAWLKANHKQSWDSMTEQFNLIFGTSYNREKIRKHCGRYLGLTSEQTRQQYQKQLPLYSERYNAKDDVIEIKVCNEIGKCKWIPKHHYIWELKTGMKIPRDYKIIHLDGDRRNNDISKLCYELENEYPDGGYVSRATMFNRALSKGKITKEVRDRARAYYGSLWNYVGD